MILENRKIVHRDVRNGAKIYVCGSEQMVNDVIGTIKHICTESEWTDISNNQLIVEYWG